VQAWTCQFEKPTPKALINDLDPSVRDLFEDLRRTIIKSVGKKPKLEWLGRTWCWSETVIPNNAGMLISLRLVADPANPRVTMTLSTGFFETYPPSTLPKTLHAGLSSATCIGHQTWCEWTVNSQDKVEGIKQILELVCEH